MHRKIIILAKKKYKHNGNWTREFLETPPDRFVEFYSEWDEKAKLFSVYFMGLDDEHLSGDELTNSFIAN
ncbi:hypothetical protein M0R19_05625 [Candidatus Pacearchaeota archaeon]|jgi:hypothetical protein|nr:hypothetical protein [Candidatus Pacearchaeota archaeon]